MMWDGKPAFDAMKELTAETQRLAERLLRETSAPPRLRVEKARPRRKSPPP
jgi:hypothetical protein